MATKCVDGGFDVTMLLVDGLEFLLIGEQDGVGELAAEVFVAGFNLVEAIEHGVWGSWAMSPGEVKL